MLLGFKLPQQILKLFKHWPIDKKRWLALAFSLGHDGIMPRTISSTIYILISPFSAMPLKEDRG